MNHKTEQHTSSRDTRQSTEQQPRVPEKKQLTLEEPASVTGGSFESMNEISAKAEDSRCNKAEAE